MVPTIKEGFTSRNGEYFDKVREVAYKKGELFGSLGTLVSESSKNLGYGNSFSGEENGVLIYQSNDNPDIAYRIYKDYADCVYYDYDDYKVLQKLLERQSKVKLTKFPTGVVTLDGYVIGQEIPYYRNFITLEKYFELHKDLNLMKIYRSILEILKEMYNNGIIYFDTHSGNFMIDSNFKIAVIDFDKEYLKIDDFSDYYKKKFFDNFRYLINHCNDKAGISDKVPKFLLTDNFDDISFQIDTMEKVLTKR